MQRFGSKAILRPVVIAALIAGITIQHYIIGADQTSLSLHNIHYLLYLFPILMAGIWYGLVGGIVAALFVSALYAPVVFGLAGQDALASVSQRILELIVFNVIGLVTGILSDRERRKKEDYIRVAEDLQQAQRLASIGQAVSVVAHEIRNPLQNIRLGVDAMRPELKGDESKREILEGIDCGVDLLNDIVNDLLDFSRPTRLVRSALPIREIVGQAVNMLKQRLRNIALHLELEQADRTISVDAAKISRVLINVISNAEEAMLDGGDLWICSQQYEVNGSSVLKISVTDTGCGIDKEHADRDLDPFFTTKSRGTGLGLPICRKIIEAHNGRLNIRSKAKEGTSVEILLPL